MPTINIYPSEDGYINSSSSVYADARSGSGTLTLYRNQVQFRNGQSYVYAYNVLQSFLAFDTSVIDSISGLDTVTAVVLKLRAAIDATETDFTLQWRLASSWGTLGTADWLAIAAFEALTLAASKTVSPTSGAHTAFTSEAAFLAGLNTSGMTYLVGMSDRAVAGTTPTNSEIVTWYGNAEATTAYRPYLEVTYTTVAPGTPTITAPAQGYATAPGETLSLTASATSPSDNQVKYRWKYSRDGGADQTIGDTSLVDSGDPATYSWGTTALATGTYLLKCWAVDDLGVISQSNDEVTVYLANALITAPIDGASQTTGTITLTAAGYSTSAGQIRIQWEIDTANPPSSANDDYDLITSELTDQGEPVSVVGSVSHLGTWYVRARVDLDGTPSDWSSVLTVYVLEALNLRPGSQVVKSILEAANRVYVRVDKADPVIIVSATNDTGDFAHSTTPREIALIAPEGTDKTGAQAIANKQLTLRGDELTTYSGLTLELADGMKLSRGQRVGIQIDRMSVNVTTIIRNLVFDIPSDTCTVTVGDFNAPQDVWDAFLALFQEMQALRKEGA